MYSKSHEHEVKVEMAWRRYISACEDITVSYSKVSQYRDEFNKLLNSCPSESENYST